MRPPELTQAAYLRLIRMAGHAITRGEIEGALATFGRNLDATDAELWSYLSGEQPWPHDAPDDEDNSDMEIGE